VKAGREIDLGALQTPGDAVRRLLRVRFAECLEHQAALAGEDDEAMHAFRLACKRLRYAIERSTGQHPELEAAAVVLSKMTDELGAAHDCVVLGRRAEQIGAPIVASRTRQDRDRFVKRARRLWRTAFAAGSPFAALAQFTGYTWRTA
jgi:CHAD domain-containing protein